METRARRTDALGRASGTRVRQPCHAKEGNCHVRRIDARCERWPSISARPIRKGGCIGAGSDDQAHVVRTAAAGVPVLRLRNARAGIHAARSSRPDRSCFHDTFAGEVGLLGTGRAPQK